MDIFIFLLIVMALCGAVQETVRDTLQEHLDPQAYAARRQRQRKSALGLLVWMLAAIVAIMAVVAGS